MFFQNGCYTKIPNLRIRAIPEMRMCVVFTPDDPKLYSLDGSAWLVLEMCDGRRGVDIESEYCDAMVPGVTRARAAVDVRNILTDLCAKRLIECSRPSV